MPKNISASKAELGQFFTRNSALQDLAVSLLTTRSGRVLEPSAGAGHLVAALERWRPHVTVTALDLAPSADKVCDGDIDAEDFFSFVTRTNTRFEAVLTNPPFVALNRVSGETLMAAGDLTSRYGKQANLYYLFLDRCLDLLVDGGEMVAIVPKEWLYTTSAAPLRAKLHAQGALTHLVDCGEEKLFPDADVPALVLFRFVKGADAAQPFAFWSSFGSATKREAPESRTLVSAGSGWLLLSDSSAEVIRGWGLLGNVVKARVGTLTGLDAAFVLSKDHHIEPSMVRQLVGTKKTAVSYLDAEHIHSAADLPPAARAHLDPHRRALESRGAADPKAWWKYTAARNATAMSSTTPRIFALAKSRSLDPFFACEGTHHGAGVLGLYLVEDCLFSAAEILEVLNSATYREVLVCMGLTTGNKLTLQPSTLHAAPFPRTRDQLSAVLGHAPAAEIRYSGLEVVSALAA